MRENTPNMEEDTRLLGSKTSCANRLKGACSLSLIFAVVLLVCVTITLVVVLDRNRHQPIQPGREHFTVYGSPGVRLPGVARFPAITAGPFKAVFQTENEDCSDIGVDILRRNGSVVDAAIAVHFCTGVTLPQSCGLGGGFFMTIYAAENRGSGKPFVNTINARETAPSALPKNPRDLPSTGGPSVAVPADLKGLWQAWQLYGRLTWSELVIPTVRLLKQGIKVDRHLEEMLQVFEESVRKTPGLRALFVNGGRLLSEGDIYYNPKLLETMRKIAAISDMSVDFVPIAKAMAQDIQDAGGIVTEEDIRMSHSKVQPPIVSHLPYRNITLYSPPLPSSGAVVQFILHILDGYNSSITEDSPVNVQRLVEALKFGYARRTEMGDPRFIDVQQLMRNLTSHDYVESIRKQINDTTRLSMSSYGAHFSQVPDAGTCGFNVASPDGIAVTTASINSVFGSKVVGRRTGIIFNNDMDDFSFPDRPNLYGLDPSPANFAEPGKSPLSSMSPTLIVNAEGNMKMGIYGNGGSRIISAIVQTFLGSPIATLRKGYPNIWHQSTGRALSWQGVLQFLYRGRSLGDAVAAPRLHQQLEPDVLYHEEDIPQYVLNYLRKAGQQDSEIEKKIAIIGMAFGLCDPETAGNKEQNCRSYGASDGRRGGDVDGL